MEIEAGQFAIYKYQVVAVNRILNFTGKLGKSAVITFCARNKDCRPQTEEVTILLDELTPFNKESAGKLEKRYNHLISNCNIQLHAIRDCLNYM